MNEIIIKILDTFEAHGVNVNAKNAQLALEIALDNYNITSKTYDLALATDIPEKAYFFISCKKLEGVKDTTLKNYMYVLKSLSSLICKPLVHITTVDLRQYVSIRSKELKRSSIAPVIWCIKSFFAWLNQEGYIQDNPALKLVTPKIDKNLRDALTVEQVELCRNACIKPRERAIFEFFFGKWL